jgi:hypothetical protein
VVNVDINQKKYKVIESWSEMTIDQAVEIYKACDAIPDKLNDIYKALTDKEALATATAEADDADCVKHFPKFYGKIITLVSDIPEDIVDRISWSERTAFFNQYVEKFVIGLLYHPYDFKAKGIKSFAHEEQVYFLPETKTVINDQRTFADATAIEFAESADLELHSRSMAGGKFEVAANIISILCRPEGEVYNEDVSLKRAESFRSLSMSVFYEVFFCLDLRLKNFRNASTTYLVESVSKAKPNQRSQALRTLAGTVQSSV